MVQLGYVGADPNSSEGGDIVDVLTATAALSSGPISQTQMTSQVASAATTYATVAYVNTDDSLLAPPAYYAAKDALQIPLTALGQPSGVATLDSGGHVPLAQLPSVGAGYVLGPFGPTAVFAGSASNTPLKIADWNIGVQPLEFLPWVFMSLLATSEAGGYPVIEVRISNGSAVYGSQTLIGMGVGRNVYNDYQAIAVLPVCATTSEVGTVAGYASSYNTWISAWIYDGAGQTSTLGSGGISSAAVFLVRDKQ